MAFDCYLLYQNIFNRRLYHEESCMRMWKSIFPEEPFNVASTPTYGAKTKYSPGKLVCFNDQIDFKTSVVSCSKKGGRRGFKKKDCF